MSVERALVLVILVILVIFLIRVALCRTCALRPGLAPVRPAPGTKAGHTLRRIRR